MARLTTLARFYTALAQLLEAGLPVTRALESAAHASQLPNAAGLAAPLARGCTLAETLGRSGAVPPHHLTLIALGEVSGRTEIVLRDLAGFMEQLATLRRALLTGCLLPALVLHAAAFIGPLPAWLLGGSALGYWRASVGFLGAIWAVGLLSVALVRALPAAPRAMFLDSLPGLGRLWRSLDCWRVATSMEMLTNAGLGVISALRASAAICHRPRLAAALRGAAAAAETEGQSVSATLGASGEFPPELIAFWAVGEQSGRLDDALQRIATQLADQCRQRLTAVALWLPRLVYAAVSAYVITQIFRLAGQYRHLLDSL